MDISGHFGTCCPLDPKFIHRILSYWYFFMLDFAEKVRNFLASMKEDLNLNNTMFFLAWNLFKTFYLPKWEESLKTPRDYVWELKKEAFYKCQAKKWFWLFFSMWASGFQTSRGKPLSEVLKTKENKGLEYSKSLKN